MPRFLPDALRPHVIQLAVLATALQAGSAWAAEPFVLKAGEGELGQVGVGREGGPGGAQPRHRRAVPRRRGRVGERLRGGRGRVARDIEQALHAHGQAGQRRQRQPGALLRIDAGRDGGAALEAAQETVGVERGVGGGLAAGERLGGAESALLDVAACSGEVEGHEREVGRAILYGFI